MLYCIVLYHLCLLSVEGTREKANITAQQRLPVYLQIQSAGQKKLKMIFINMLHYSLSYL